MTDERRAEIEAVAEALLPWRCYNGHIVPGWAMPQSGTKCNVAGCDRPGRYRSTDPLHRLDAQSAAEKVIDALDRVRDARGDDEVLPEPQSVKDYKAMVRTAGLRALIPYVHRQAGFAVHNCAFERCQIEGCPTLRSLLARSPQGEDHEADEKQKAR